MAWIHGLAVGIVALAAATALAYPSNWLKDWRKNNPVWRGVHLAASNDAALEALGKQVPTLARAGVNVLIVEVDYSYQFTHRPEMNDPGGISKEGARKFADLCRQYGVRPIPQMNCLGHQSWAKTTETLLVKHPELDETPGQYPDNKDIYCRSWCPQHPDLQKVVYPLIDDLIDGFQADAFHVGMDEVFIIGSEFCPRCKGQDTAKLFAKAVNDLHDHIVRKRRIEMLMWADRFLDGKATGYGEWEASTNGTAPSIDKVPKDIVMCDWHYDKRDDYPSLKILADKGFRVWPSSWKDSDAAVAFANQAKAMNDAHVIGHLVTTWGAIDAAGLPTWKPFTDSMAVWTSK